MIFSNIEVKTKNNERFYLPPSSFFWSYKTIKAMDLDPDFCAQSGKAESEIEKNLGTNHEDEISIVLCEGLGKIS